MKQILVSRSVLAHGLDLSENRIAQLISHGVLPKALGRGQFDLTASVRAYLQYLRLNSRGTLAQERTRLTKAKADKEELLFRLRSKELIEVSVVEKTLFEKGRQIRDALQSLADRLAGILAPVNDQTKVHAILTKEVHQALEALTE
jgi:phage terminase Nu1 subunit (DNA packaging protein)